MSVKLIAVDMDGTFLSDAKTYNRPRFLNQYQRMREQNIRFVVASGNQYYQLISFFPDIAHEIAFAMTFLTVSCQKIISTPSSTICRR